MAERIERVELASTRFTDEERTLIAKRQCSRQTAYGLPWTEFCRLPLVEADQVECAEHEADSREQFPGQPVVRLKVN